MNVSPKAHIKHLETRAPANVLAYYPYGSVPCQDLDLEVSSRVLLRTCGFRTCTLYLCVRTDVKPLHYLCLPISEADLRLLVISGTCFFSLLLYSPTWLRAFHRSLRNGQQTTSSSARFLTMFDHILCAHTPLTATESDRKYTAFQSLDLRQTMLSP